MCGIIGVYQVNDRINKTQLIKATNTLAHRGPNDSKYWLSNDGHIGLGHRRLSIHDLSHGKQPITNAQNTLFASVNGEFYDYKKLKTQLIQQGFQFQTHSDSELLLHLYAKYQLNFVKYLRGEFAFILVDVLRKTIIAVRDRFGIKPLHYHFNVNKGLFIASEAKALFELNIKPAWDDYALFHALSFQYLPIGSSLFKEIKQLPAGHMMIYDGNTLQLKQYWDLNYPKNEKPITVKNAIEKLDLHLNDAVQSRLDSEEGNICCHLSSGVDSASIAAIANKLHHKPIPCFTVSFPHQNYDEKHIAETFAKEINAPFYSVDVDLYKLIDALPNAVYFTEGLAINNHLPAKYLLNQAIKKAGYNIALTGEGADELFYGYPHLQPNINDDLTNNIANNIYVTNDTTLPLELIQNKLKFIPNFIKAKAAIGFKIHQVMDNARFDTEKVFSDIANLVPQNQLGNLSKIQLSCYFWIKYALSGYILKTLGDGCEMAHGIEGRVPFLDSKLFDFVKFIPHQLKIYQNTEKFILRETVKKYVSNLIVNKKKHPFMSPPFCLIDQKIGYAFTNDLLLSYNLPFINKNKLITLLNNLPKMHISEQIAIEPMLMLLITATLLGKSYHL